MGTLQFQDNKSTITTWFRPGVQTCRDVSFPTNVPQRRVLNVCHILLQYSFTTIHIPFHLVLCLFEVEGLFFLMEIYQHETEQTHQWRSEALTKQSWGHKVQQHSVL